MDSNSLSVPDTVGRPSGSFTEPLVPGVPQIVFGDAATALGPLGNTVPMGVPAGMDFGNPAGASPRPVGSDDSGQGSQAGDHDFYEVAVNPQPTPPSHYESSYPPNFTLTGDQ